MVAPSECPSARPDVTLSKHIVPAQKGICRVTTRLHQRVQRGRSGCGTRARHALPTRRRSSPDSPRHPLMGLLSGGRHLDRTRGLAMLCGVDVNEVLLPGIGLRYEFTSAEGRRIGIVARREGDFEVVCYDRTDPDRSRLLLRLTVEEADTVAEILGAPRIAERFADLTREVPGLSAGQIEIDPARGTPAARLVRPGPEPGPERRSWRSSGAMT